MFQGLSQRATSIAKLTAVWSTCIKDPMQLNLRAWHNAADARGYASPSGDILLDFLREVKAAAVPGLSNFQHGELAMKFPAMQRKGRTPLHRGTFQKDTKRLLRVLFFAVK